MTILEVYFRFCILHAIIGDELDRLTGNKSEPKPLGYYMIRISQALNAENPTELAGLRTTISTQAEREYEECLRF